MTRPTILILGPTAGGKTALALALARRLPASGAGPGGECICCDSMQVYRGLDIGTGKPTPDQRSAVPHHLLDVLEPHEARFSVDTWLQAAESAIAEIRGRGRWPLVVGGTNLFVQALLHGLFEGPAPDPALRADLQAAGLEALRGRLESVDPEAARRIHPNDRRRTVRALEVFTQTGRRISDLQRQWTGGPGRQDVRILGLAWSPAAINRRINARVKAMREAGLAEEVRALWAAGRLGHRAGQALGYKQLVAHLVGRCSLEEAFERIKIATRRLAKQQRTWLRRFRAHPRAVWLDAEALGPQGLVDEALRRVLKDTPNPAAPDRFSNPAAEAAE